MFLFLSAGVLAQENYPAVLECEMESEILGTTKKYCIYLPAGYGDESRSFPVLYLLHGLTDTHTAWRDRGNMKEIATAVFGEGKAQEMIIVMPDAGTTYDGYFNCPEWRYEDYFFEEFVPHVENKYRIIADRQHRAIAGLSMGGGGCTSYAQRHADMFGACYAMSAFLHMGAEGVDAQKVAQGDKTALLFEAAHRLSCVDYVKNADEARKQELRTVAWFVDCGDDDFLFDGNIDFYQTMRRAQIPCQLRVRDGGHTCEYWHSALYTALPFVSRQFGK